MDRVGNICRRRDGKTRILQWYFQELDEHNTSGYSQLQSVP